MFSENKTSYDTGMTTLAEDALTAYGTDTLPESGAALSAEEVSDTPQQAADRGSPETRYLALAKYVREHEIEETLAAILNAAVSNRTEGRDRKQNPASGPDPHIRTLPSPPTGDGRHVEQLLSLMLLSLLGLLLLIRPSRP